ncbi:hypothetical protein SODALDRAFT_65330 [Sodiomyces alkalinus F11]|uniref:Uncharacterized protein n=1 Tax=Sodiomyces alkalinus (strain CBS 110278 / VKM F-3762 / F11) TaxID=1314773 RepID=A0A3N2PLI8_SODAK|nr:hypothetical protein SODALDRAFT_65330 [Sodiomyces alkalinus F11]ROT35401.1 hypothetical protein SODALDRAFT_65330 [Sodiomyces alkalinus F11]
MDRLLGLFCLLEVGCCNRSGHYHGVFIFSFFFLFFRLGRKKRRDDIGRQKTVKTGPTIRAFAGVVSVHAGAFSFYYYFRERSPTADGQPKGHVRITWDIETQSTLGYTNMLK